MGILFKNGISRDLVWALTLKNLEFYMVNFYLLENSDIALAAGSINELNLPSRLRNGTHFQ